MDQFTLQALRRLLFFTRQEAASLIAASDEHPLGVSERSWRMWEDGTRLIPDDVIEVITRLINWRERAIDAGLSQIEAMAVSRGEATTISLVWYDTHEDWMSLVGREPLFYRPHQSVVATIAAASESCRLVGFNADHYTAWLGTRHDREQMRSLWAAQK